MEVYVCRDCQRVARGELPRQVFLQDCLRQMRACLESCMAEARKMDEAMAKYFSAFGSAENIAGIIYIHTYIHTYIDQLHKRLLLYN